MAPEAFRALCLSLPGAEELPHFDRASFRVRKKIFATMRPDGSEAMVRVSPPGLVDALLRAQPGVFFSYGGWTTRNGSLGVRLAKAKAAQLRELVEASWTHVAPKSMVAARR